MAASKEDELPLLVFLFASPLVRERMGASGKREVVASPQLDADVELTELHRMLTECGKAVRLRSEPCSRRPAAPVTVQLPVSLQGIVCQSRSALHEGGLLARSPPP